MFLPHLFDTVQNLCLASHLIVAHIAVVSAAEGLWHQQADILSLKLCVPITKHLQKHLRQFERNTLSICHQDVQAVLKLYIPILDLCVSILKHLQEHLRKFAGK